MSKGFRALDDFVLLMMVLSCRGLEVAACPLPLSSGAAGVRSALGTTIDWCDPDKAVLWSRTDRSRRIAPRYRVAGACGQN